MLNEWIMIGVIIFVIYTQLATKLTNDVIFLTAMLIILLTGVLKTEQVFMGLVSSATLFLIFMFVIVECMQKTGALRWIMRLLLGKHRSMTVSLSKMMLVGTTLSALVSNPSVAQIMYHSVAEWGRKYNIAPSKLLLPVAYLISIGGTCTIIAYPVNLVLFSILENATGKHYGILTPLHCGVICSAVCAIAILLFQRWLPDCKDPMEAMRTHDEYLLEAIVPSKNAAIGQTVGEMGFTNLSFGKLIGIHHYDGESVSDVKSDEFIMGGDRLVFKGDISELIQLRDKLGFASATHHVYEYNKDKHATLQKVSLTLKSPYLGKRICDTTFEEDNNVALVALLREGEKIDTLPRETELKAGDMLIFEGDKLKIAAGNEQFILHDAPEFQGLTWRSIVSLLSLPILILLSTTGIMPLVDASFLFAIVLCAIHCCSRSQAWASINWNFVVLLTGAFAIGLAIKDCGLANHISILIQSMCGTDPIQTLIVITIAAVALTQVLFDATVVPILAPIAIVSASNMGLNPLPFILAVLLGSACNFTTQISTAHMMMVFPVGGFRVRDTLKFGLPLCLIMSATIILVLWALYL